MESVSSLEHQTMNAVLVNRACKSFSTSKEPLPVLHNFNMIVKEKTIFALLGASGSGKTTLLTCILGRKKLDSGDIWVLGGKPGSPESGVPGGRVGYMPQSLALCMTFTISETLHIFGRMYGMPKTKIKERITFLSSLLKLPDHNKYITTFSGGECRLVSFATTLLHEPELLILDEPTVGIDPVHRKQIWNYLKTISQNGNQTVIITTHYIEEAREANMVAMMRNGRLLCQEHPELLLSVHHTNSLQDVFQTLCMDNEDISMANELPVPPMDKEMEYSRSLNKVVGIKYKHKRKPSEIEVREVPSTSRVDTEYTTKFTSSTFQRILANTIRGFTHLIHNPVLVITVVLLPVIILVACNLTIGTPPHDLPFGVINHEFQDDPICDPDYDECNFQYLSCRFIDTLDKRMLTLVPFHDIEALITATINGYVLGGFIFPMNFSEHFINRVQNPINVDNQTLENSVVQIRMDKSNILLASFVEKMVYNKYQEFFSSTLKSCDINPILGNVPVDFSRPIVSGDIKHEKEFDVLLGAALMSIYYFAVGFTAVAFIINRNEGLTERLRIAGLTSSELLISHIIEHYIIMVSQISGMVCVFWIYDLHYVGSTILLYALFFLQGTAGMCLGLLTYSLSSDAHTGGLFIVGLFSVSYLVCGLTWPIDSQSYIIQWIAYFMPNTLPVKTAEIMATRGFGIFHKFVYPGFVASIIWAVTPLFLTCLLMRKKDFNFA